MRHQEVQVRGVLEEMPTGRTKMRKFVASEDLEFGDAVQVDYVKIRRIKGKEYHTVYVKKCPREEQK